MKTRVVPKAILLAAATLAICLPPAMSTPVERPESKNLSESAAVEKAEGFVIRNGYTIWPEFNNKISFESVEWSTDTTRLLERRHNTLRTKAYGVRHGRKGNAPGWTVVFRRKNGYEAGGRAVTMNLDGSEIRMEHTDFRLNAVEHRL
jgi:hypothetical protein